MSSARPLLIGGTEVPMFKVPVNRFVRQHPVTNGSLRHETRTQTGTLEQADLSEVEVSKQFALLAENFTDILLHAADDDLQHEACDAVLETVVRLQNPQYATDQVEIRAEAARMKKDFIGKELDLREQGLAAGPIDFSGDPSRALLDDFENIYVTGQYNLRAMRQKAADTLAPMIKPVVAEAFVEQTESIVEATPEFKPKSRLKTALGSLVAKLSVNVAEARSV